MNLKIGQNFVRVVRLSISFIYVYAYELMNSFHVAAARPREAENETKPVYVWEVFWNAISFHLFE